MKVINFVPMKLYRNQLLINVGLIVVDILLMKKVTVLQLKVDKLERLSKEDETDKED